MKQIFYFHKNNFSKQNWLFYCLYLDLDRFDSKHSKWSLAPKYFLFAKIRRNKSDSSVIYGCEYDL